MQTASLSITAVATSSGATAVLFSGGSMYPNLVTYHIHLVAAVLSRI
ncbi:MAG: hypothetical protein IPM39_26805 [Chloroflexi bacterium]|nr:hypothetical protein [Chloroflexota bacterium]